MINQEVFKNVFKSALQVEIENELSKIDAEALIKRALDAAIIKCVSKIVITLQNRQQDYGFDCSIRIPLEPGLSPKEKGE